MDLLLPWQTPKLSKWQRRPFSVTPKGRHHSDREHSYGRAIAQEAPGPPANNGPFRRAAEAIWRYEVFPPRLIRGVLERQPVREGDTVGIAYHAGLGARLFFAARVVAIMDSDDGSVWRSGFTYRTVLGHPEAGEETFSVEKNLSTGTVSLAFRSWSRPGLLLARVGGPVVRCLQRRGNEAALDHIECIATGGIGRHLLLYDGNCGLCDRLTRFVLPRDRRGMFRFASLQSSMGKSQLQRFGVDPHDLATFRVITNYASDDAALLSHANAVFEVLRTLGGGWRFLAMLLPARPMDGLYRLVASNRYRVFGRLEACLIPAPEYVRRFVDDGALDRARDRNIE